MIESSSDIPLEGIPRAQTDLSTMSALKPSPVTLYGPSAIIECPETVRLARAGKKFTSVPRTGLRNSLVGLIGFLELANAGDFAANVWNDVPVPLHAMILMAIGGTVALALSIPAFYDSKLSWDNVCFLRKHRDLLRKERSERIKETVPSPSRDIDTFLDVFHREYGSEVINRFGMNLIMGCGAVLIGVGTLMAMDGANHRVWLASNILSGYLGNAPVALYGLINSIWCVYLLRRVHRQNRATATALRDRPVLEQLKGRFRSIRIYAVMSGLSTLFGGVGGMLTATLWPGYIILIPVIISSFVCSLWWKRRLAYSRHLTRLPTLGMSTESIINELDYVTTIKGRLATKPGVEGVFQDLRSMGALVNFITQNDLFEEFGIYMARDDRIFSALFSSPPPAEFVEMDKTAILELPEDLHSIVIEKAQECIRRFGHRQFVYRERYLCDILASFVYISART